MSNWFTHSPRHFARTLALLMTLLLPLAGRGQNLTQTNFTGVIVPQYMGSGTGSRLPVMFRATVSGLTPTTQYRYFTGGATNSATGGGAVDFGTTNPGAGNPLLINSTGTTYSYSTSASLTSSGNYETFTTDAAGSYTGWFGFVNTGNGRFTGGNTVYPSIVVAKNTTPGTVEARYALDLGIKVLTFATAAGANNGTGFKGASNATAKNLAAVYDNTAGTGRPLAITVVENIGAAIASVPAYYSTTAGTYNTIIPNNNANGVQRVEERSVTTGAVLNCATDADGVWPSGANTVNPAGGTTAIALTAADTPLNTGCGTATPTIAVTSAMLALGTTASGTASTPAQSYSVNATALTNDLVVTAPANTEISLASTTGFTNTLTLTPASGTVAATTIYVRIAATAAPGSVSGNVTNTSTGATTQNVAVSGTVTGVAPTIATGTVGSPTCVGASGTSISVPFSTTGSFNAGNTFTVELSTAAGAFPGTMLTTTGTSSPLTATVPAATVSGTTYRVRVNASSPATTGTDNGTNLTVVSYKTNEITSYSATPGNTTVALAWTNPGSCFSRVVIIARQGSAVTVSPTGTFTANAAFGSGTDLGTVANPNQYVVYDGPGTSVTVTSLTNSSQYFFKAFTSNGDGFSNGTSVSATPSPVLSFTDVILPQLLVGHAAGGSTHTDRLPYAYRATLSGLTAGATYRYYNSAIDPATDAPTATGSGNPIFPVAAGGFVRSSGPSLSSAGNYGTLQADGTGSYTGWFILEPTGNARFDAGKSLQMRLVLNDGNNGTAAVSLVTMAATVAVRQLGTTAAQATGVQGASRASAANFVFTYDNVGGTGRPLAGSYIESDGTANTTANGYATFYGTNVDGQAGAWGLLTANDNANGIQRIEQRDLATGALAGCAATSANGTWPSGTATASPSGGTTPLVISQLDAPLTCDVLVGFNPATASLPEGNSGTTTVQLKVTVSGTPASPLTVTVADAGTGTATAGTDYTFATQTLTFAAAGTQTVSLTVNSDRLAEANETVQLSLATSGSPATVTNSPATITILDDDTVAPSLLLEEDFDYSAGTVLADNNTTPSTTTGWKAHNNNGTNNIATLAGNLTQAQYPRGASATGTQAKLLNSGQDISKPFAAPAQLANIYYTAVVNVSAAQTNGDYFFHLYDNTSAGGTLRGRVFARSSGTGGINFGVSVSGSNTAATWAPTEYQLNTNYLLVVKYATNGTATATNDDVMSLYVLDNTATPATEPATATATAGPEAGAAAALMGLNAIALRQGSASGAQAAPTLTLDGIRVATTWGTAVGRMVFTAPNGGLDAYTDAITGNPMGSYYDVTVNNNDQVAVSGVVTIENNLTLTSGLVTTSAANLLKLATGATVSGGSSTSFVNGPLARITTAGAATSVFPVGKGTLYRPITLVSTAQAAASTYTAEQFEGNATRTLAAGNGLGSAPLARVTTKRFFTVTSSNTTPGNFTGTITLSFGAEDYVNVPSSADFVIAKRDASGAFANQWTNLGRSTNTGTDAGPGGPSVDGTLTSASFSDFSDFTLGAQNDLSNTNVLAASNPLPVELTAIGAQRQADKSVAVKWATASERNSARFEVQRSLNGREFATVATVAAQGSSTHATTYNALDQTAPATRLYYRLRQIDLDGTTTFSPVVLVANAGAAAKVLLYPNPAHGRIGFIVEAATAYRVLNQLGQPLLHGITEAGPASIGIENLPTGLYFLELRTAAGRTVQKFEKE